MIPIEREAPEDRTSFVSGLAALGLLAATVVVLVILVGHLRAGPISDFDAKREGTYRAPPPSGAVPYPKQPGQQCAGSYYESGGFCNP
jgi:hypothetical protein